jgi:hypothetical protein
MLHAQEVIDAGQGAFRGGGQAFVLHQQQPVVLRAVHRLPQRVQREAHHAGLAGQPLGAGIDGAAGIEVEDARWLPFVALDQALDGIHHPGHVAHAADHLAVREQRRQRRQLGGPLAVGVEHGLLRRDAGVIGVEHGAQDRLTVLVVQEGGAFVALAHGPQQGVEQAAHRAGHGRVQLRVLPQQRREQGGAGAWQAGDEMNAVFHAVKLGIRRPSPQPSPSGLELRSRSRLG